MINNHKIGKSTYLLTFSVYFKSIDAGTEPRSGDNEEAGSSGLQADIQSSSVSAALISHTSNPDLITDDEYCVLCQVMQKQDVA